MTCLIRLINITVYQSWNLFRIILVGNILLMHPKYNYLSLTYWETRWLLYNIEELRSILIKRHFSKREIEDAIEYLDSAPQVKGLFSCLEPLSDHTFAGEF